MKINTRNLNLALAKACLTISDLRHSAQLSSVVLAKIKNNASYEPNTKTIGKIAKALGVSVEYLTEGV